ncbi:MAG: hypothetical protein AUJ98_08535 [Bacteroidetes bacterium CG2_30_33_31]|nr:MAG: hypothetical protein AUJ98_08535 [Bacteroidetes bacterium CG2_30_33_31]
MNRFKLSLIVGFTLIINFGFAQNDTTTTEDKSTSNNSILADIHKFRIGVYGNAALSWMKPQNIAYTSQGSRLVAGWGVNFDYNFTENYTLNTGFGFRSYGGKLKYQSRLDSATIGIMERKYKIKYIDIPINLKLKTNQIGYYTYFIQLGLNNGFRLKAAADDNFVSATGTGSYTINDVGILSTTKLYRLSFVAGIGAEYQISKSFGAIAMISYNHGLVNVLDGVNSYDNNINENAIINGITLTAGFLF